MDGQLSLFDIDLSYTDKTYDRNGEGQAVPSWMGFDRCENCERWHRLTASEQPPAGWGVYGWCAEHNNRTEKCSYCCNIKNQRRLIL